MVEEAALQVEALLRGLPMRDERDLELARRLAACLGELRETAALAARRERAVTGRPVLRSL